MFARINNLITKKTFLGFLLCVIVFLAPVSATYTQSNGATEQKITGEVLTASAKDTKFTDLLEPELPKIPGYVASYGFEKFGLWLGNTLLSTASMFTYVGGKALDTSLKMTVFEMGKHINNQSGNLGNKINDTWKIIRDICNLTFIFGFVYIGIRTIIDPESASTKRFLSKIIIGALLINFSLFFVKFIVDISNFTAYHIYNAMVSGDGSLSATVANMLGIVSLFTASDPNQFAEITGGGMFWFFILGAVLLLVVAFVFFAAAILLIIRFVALVLIMVGSPILFAATVFPQTESYASDMWKKLIHYAFFAPVFLLLILISLTLVQGLGTTIVPSGSSFVAAMKGGSDNTGAAIGQMGIILNFIIIIFFFIQSLLLAQKMGVAGGDAAVSVGNKIRGNVQSAIGRNTVGVASHKIREGYEKLDSKIEGNATARSVRKWGMRAANVATLGAAGGVLNDRTIRKTLEAGEHAKFGGSYSHEDDQKYDGEAKKRALSIRAAVAREKAIEEASATGATPTPVQMDTMVKSIKALTTDQMKDMDINILTREDVAVHLSTKQIDELEKTGKYSDSQITSIKDARKTGVKAIATGAKGAVMVGGQSQRELLAQRGSDELAKMPIEVFTSTDMMPHLTPELLEAKMKTGVSSADLTSIQVALDGEIGGRPLTDPYVKQWIKWNDKSPIAARLGLTTI